MTKAILLSGNNAWGMFNFRGALMRHLMAEGYTVYVSAPEDDEFFQKLRDMGCHPIAMPVQAKGKNPLKDLQLTWRYRKLLKELRPVVSITYTIKPNIYGSMAAQWARVRYLPITTGLGYVFLNKGLTSCIAKGLYRFAFKYARRVWFLNKDDMRVFREQHLVKDEKIEQLYGEGVDLSRFAYQPRESQVNGLKFLYVGRLLYDKGLQEYADAARILKEKYPKAEFHILGKFWPDNPTAISQETMQSWVDGGYIVYEGSTDDVRPFLYKADCAVLPSYREGMPFSLMEAAATGLPLVATDVPGCNEVVVDGENGYLCKAKDSYSLVAAMERIILATPEKLIEMGYRSRLLMEKEFSIERIIEQYDQFLHDIS